MTLQLHRAGAEIFVPSDLAPQKALSRTTHLAIGAHPDDVEIFAAEGILQCWGKDDHSFCALIVSDGRGCARSGPFAEMDDAQMRLVRREEQKHAARLGKYGAAVLLDYESRNIKDPSCRELTADLVTMLRATRPRTLYTHNPTDRHTSHLATLLHVLAALSILHPTERPSRIVGCEVWGDLDWLPTAYRLQMDVSDEPELQASLLGSFQSQLAGGKRYDLAALGRRRAHATFSESHRVDSSSGVILGVDLSPVLADPRCREHPAQAVREFVERIARAFSEEMSARFDKLS